MIDGLIAFLTGGRPMRRIAYRFNDMFENKPVYLMEDFYGRHWLAAHPWAWFRVKREEVDLDDKEE